MWNPALYDQQIVPLFYLSGVLLFAAGVSIVAAHNMWVAAWPVLITVVGWTGIILGMLRAFFPQACLSSFNNGAGALISELIIMAIGILISIKGYRKR